MDIGGQVASAFGPTELVRPLWPHQREALAALGSRRAEAGTAAYLVVPPGGGKTLIGLEAARRLGRPTVVLCPNTAIQSQWISQWQDAFAPTWVRATSDREAPTALTVLTYQALCTLGQSETAAPQAAPAALGPALVRRGGQARPGAPAGDESLLSLLHPNGLALIERLRVGGPLTVVLDECHHLLELWGRLLKTVLGQLDDPHVIGLTATPPHLMTREQAELHVGLFGDVDLEVAAPALVRDGRLSPYQELAYFARPTPAEADHIHGEAVRFAELTAGLLDPGFAATPFLRWLQGRVVERRGEQGVAVSWQRFEREEPALADAALRLHTAGLLPLPDGASIREQHRRQPTADDWVALIGDYCRRCLLASGDERDQAAYEAIRQALPSVGYRLTRSVIRAGDSPVDRVLARSAGKAYAAAEILRAEASELGPRLRALVLCDFENAGGTPPARLTGVLPAEAGGARLALETLLADPDAALLEPVLMTGRRVACGPATAERLIEWARAANPDLELVAIDADPLSPQDGAGEPEAASAIHAGAVAEITGPGWTPRRYVPLVTRFFAEGGSRCLIGTRALLGEGWDAPAVNVLVDLTASATATSVVQARGRALRLDPAWPDKVADNWAVVCVTDDHPKGAADYDRLVRKHDQYFALARSGDIVSGVAHVDPGLSPYAPPPAADLDRLNAAMLQRPARRAEVREQWAVGQAYRDVPVATVTVGTRRPLGLAGRAALPLTRPRTRRQVGSAVLAAGAALTLTLLFAPVAAGTACLAALAVLAGVVAVGRMAARISALPAQACLDDMAVAAAQALHEAGLTSQGGEHVRTEALADGTYRARLLDVPEKESQMFTAALEELLSPLAQPRYVIPRLVAPTPAGPGAAIGLAARRLATGRLPVGQVYHAVPSALAARKELAAIFERAWNAHVSPGSVLYTGAPEGAGVLAAQRGDDPFAVTTTIHTLWH